MATYRVILHVTSATLPTLLGTIDNAGGIRLVSVSDTEDREPLPPSPPPPARAPEPIDVAPHFVGGKRDKGIKGDELVLEVLRSGPASMEELRRAFVNRTFAPGSTGQYVSRLLKTQQIERRPNGRYALTINGSGAAIMSPAVTFLATLFERATPPVFLTSLTNDRAATQRIPPRQIVTRDCKLVDRFIEKWDRPERALYFCVATLRPGITRRAKANLHELVCLHCDLDFKNMAARSLKDILEAVSRVKPLPPLPSIAVFSGHGLHLYWRLRQALPATPENIARAEAALRRVADVFAGDPAVCESSRLMRVPGSHNTKDGAWIEVELIRHSSTTYTLEELEAWLATAKPLLERRPSEKQKRNPWSELAAAQIVTPPIDVVERLAEMTHHGPGETSIHLTQLSVTAAMLRRGYPVDEVIARVMEATAIAAGREGANWNWRAEERTVRAMCRSWLEKHPQYILEI